VEPCFLPTPTGEGHKRLGGKLITSPRDLTTRESSLPWAHGSFATFLGRVKNAPSADTGPMAVGGACSRAVNAGSVPRTRSPATAAGTVNRRRGSGGAGGPANATGPARTARNAAASKAGVTACVGGNERQPQLPTARRPRASAQPPIRKIPAGAPVTVRAATNSSCPRPALPNSAFVAAAVASPYAGFASGRCVNGSGAVAVRGRGGYGPVCSPVGVASCRHVFSW
jgi:hypothetical protein